MISKGIVGFSVGLLLAGAGAMAQSTGGSSPGGADTVLACYALGVGELRADVGGFKKMGEAEILRRLERQVARAAQQPGVMAMLGCILRRTAD